MDLKLCPTCKTFVFDDMDTCYGCMYRFGSDPEREEAVRREIEGSDFPEEPLGDSATPAVPAAVDLAGCGREGPWPPPCEEAPSSWDESLGEMRDPLRSPVTETMVMGCWKVALRTGGSPPEGPSLQVTIEPAR